MTLGRGVEINFYFFPIKVRWLVFNIFISGEYILTPPVGKQVAVMGSIAIASSMEHTAVLCCIYNLLQIRHT